MTSFNKISLLDDRCDDAGADGTATFADSKAQAFIHRNRRNQGHRHRNIITRHHHLCTIWQFNRTGHICRTEIELADDNFEKNGV